MFIPSFLTRENAYNFFIFFKNIARIVNENN